MTTNKSHIRDYVWKRMEEEKIGRFPFPLQNRIPNFKSAEKAAAHVTTLSAYRDAEAVKVNPDAPQLPLRAQVLIDGKTLLVPTPRLKAGFIQVKPEWVPRGEEKKAVSLTHMKRYGKELSLSDIPRIDLIVVGSVAVHKDGRRLGKGEGYADREYAILTELGNPKVPVVTTIHSVQIVEADIPIEAYDLTADWIATEDEIFSTNTPYPKPTGIDWNQVTEGEKEEMPVLAEISRLVESTKWPPS